jgi:histidine triad (HIT) family protein
MNSVSSCIFCKIINRQIEADRIAETEDFLVIKDTSPKAPIHYLIIPKKHVADIQSLAIDDFVIGERICELAQQLHKREKKDFRLVINSGAGAGQKVFHLHVHFLAGGFVDEF